MQIIVRWLALWLLMSQMAAMAADVGRCAGTLSDEQRRYLQVCLDREAQCTDYWPGYPDDVTDCVRVQKWLTKAMTMPPGMRHEIFGPMPEHVAGSREEPAPSGKEAPPAWKSLPRSEDSAALRPVAGPMTGVTASDYAGASSQLDPEQARAAGVAFWTGQIVQIAGIVAEANRAPAGSPRSFAVPITNAPRPVAVQTAFAEPPDSQTMNPGQLFAKAEELNAQGDRVRAREVQRALMSQFPDHPLAAIVARQAGDSESGASSPDGGASPRPSVFAKENSRHSSVCARNIAKVEQVLSAANIERYAGLGTFDFDFYDMVNRVAQRCMANDPLMKTTHESNERNRSQLRSYCQTQSRPCSRWGDSEPEASKNQRWFELFSAEYNKMMADWDGYSRELDGPGGGSSPEGPRSAGGRLSSQQCEAMRRTVDATRVPANASSVTAATETNMFMTKMTLDMIDGRCPGMGVDRISAQQAYKAAEDACNAVQSGGRRCVAQSHYGPAARPQSPVAATGNPQRAAQSGGSGASSATGGNKASRLPPDNRQCRNCTAN